MEKEVIDFLNSQHGKKILLLASLNEKTKISINKKEYEVKQLIEFANNIQNKVS